jgi:hypothetical protein
VTPHKFKRQQGVLYPAFLVYANRDNPADPEGVDWYFFGVFKSVNEAFTAIVPLEEDNPTWAWNCCSVDLLAGVGSSHPDQTVDELTSVMMKLSVAPGDDPAVDQVRAAASTLWWANRERVVVTNINGQHLPPGA